MKPAISVAGLTRRYRGQRALDDVTFDVEAGSITGGGIVMDQPSRSAASAPQAAVPALSPAPQAPVTRSDRVPVLAWVIAGVFVAVELTVSARYGFQQDELYFIMAGRHLAFGYVDQPPLTPLLTRITGVLGVSPTSARIIPALAGGAVVVAAARLAALFGAGRPGRVLAALTTACAPVVIGAVHLGNTTPLDLLAWAAVLLCVTTALLRHKPRWWLGAGAAAGVGLENNNLLAMLLTGLAVSILVSEHRPVLRTRWPWLGAGIAAVIWAPNVIWQATHGWPQLAMASALHTLPASSQHSSVIGDTIGWPQLTRAVAAQDAALVRAGRPPTAIFTGYYAEAAALDVLGPAYHLPPVLSGHNAYWMWGPGPASDAVVLVVDALGQLRPYFARCRLLTTYHAPYQVQNNWTDIQIGICTGPVASWRTLWPHLKHYG